MRCRLEMTQEKAALKSGISPNTARKYEKLKQLTKFDDYIYGDILEQFAGQGNLTEHYKQKGNLYQCTK